MTDPNIVVEELMALLDEAVNWLREDNDYLSSMEAVVDAKSKVRAAILKVAEQALDEGYERAWVDSCDYTRSKNSAGAWLNSETRAALEGK